MGRSHPAQWTIMSPACRTPSADLPTRTALLGLGQPGSTRNNVLAPGGLLSGEILRSLLFKSNGVTVPRICYSPGPVWLLSWHLSQSTIQRRGREISSAPADGLHNGQTGAVFFTSTLLKHHYSDVFISGILSLAHALFWVQSFPSGSPHVATFASLCLGYHEVFPARRAS